MLVESLEKQSGLDLSKLHWIADTASSRYKIYPIKKKNGENRIIAHPSRQLKSIQRWVNKRLFANFPVHERATAYKIGGGIRSNAEFHQHTKFTLRLDFENFFPSFQIRDIRRYLTSQNEHLGIGLSEYDIEFVCAICTRHQRLTIGAPSSPKITNAMMYGFDEAVSAFSQENNITYTRYADDIFLSSAEPNKLGHAYQEALRIIENYNVVPLTLNRDKTTFLSRRYKRSIAGVVVTPDYCLSIGRNRKREIKALIHLYSLGALPEEKEAYLQGLMAFAMDIEPQFRTSMNSKYGAETIKSLLRQFDAD